MQLSKNVKMMKPEFWDENLFTPVQDKILKVLEEAKSQWKRNGKTFVIPGYNRKTLSLGLKIPRTTLFDNLIKLMKRGHVFRINLNNYQRGRSTVFWIHASEGNKKFINELNKQLQGL